MKERKKSIHKNQPPSTKTQNILLFNLIKYFFIFRGTKVAHVGECKKFCNCVSTTYAPVCGEDGRTYSSWCSAQCE